MSRAGVVEEKETYSNARLDRHRGLTRERIESGARSLDVAEAGRS